MFAWLIFCGECVIYVNDEGCFIGDWAGDFVTGYYLLKSERFSFSANLRSNSILAASDFWSCSFKPINYFLVLSYLKLIECLSVTSWSFSSLSFLTSSSN